MSKRVKERTATDTHHLPELEVFRQKWDDSRSRANTTVPNGELPTFVVGIFSTLNETDIPYRNVVRSTWMDHPLVCSVADYHKDRTDRNSTCRFFTTFVVGRDANGSGNVTTLEDDITVLGVPESMNCGKSRAWFSLAARRFPWAAHIAKMDMDAFVDVHQLTLRMRDDRRPCPQVFGGVSHICGKFHGHKLEDDHHCPPPECYRWPYNRPKWYDFVDRSNAICWHYMQGGFYFLSNGLARNVSETSGLWRATDRDCAPEDLATGHAIDDYARAHDICVSAVNIGPDKVVRHLH